MNDKAIPWGDTSVHLVMLISINEKDIMTFNTIYSSIIDLLLDDESFDEMLKSKTFDELSVYLEIMFKKVVMLYSLQLFNLYAKIFHLLKYYVPDDLNPQN